MFKLLKKSVLPKNKNFQTVYRLGKSYANKHLVLYIVKNNSDERRVGFAAGKKLGNAVTRNRVKRQLREAYRLSQRRLLNSGIDMIIVGRQAVIGQKTQVVTAALHQLFNRAGILIK